MKTRKEYLEEAKSFGCSDPDCHICKRAASFMGMIDKAKPIPAILSNKKKKEVVYD
jgi:hypothetical protein